MSNPDAPRGEPRSISDLVAAAKSNWCALTHGHGMLAAQIAAIDELARRASPAGGGDAPSLSEEDWEVVKGALPFLALHHQHQIELWNLTPKHREHARICAHHNAEIDAVSRLAGKLGMRDWRSARSAPPAPEQTER